MTQIHRIAILIPLLIGACVVVCTMLIHGLTLNAAVRFVRHEKKVGRAGAHFWSDLVIVTLTMSIALVAHLMEIALWAVLFKICGEFPDLGTAYYHLAVNYTTLGYGDLIMTPCGNCWAPWKQPTGCSCSAFRRRSFLPSFSG